MRRLHVPLLAERGQTLAEYGVTLTVITIALVATFTAFSASIRGTILRAATLIP